MPEVPLIVKLWLALAAVWSVGSAAGMVAAMFGAIDDSLVAGWVFGGLATLLVIVLSGLAVSVWVK